MAHQRHHLPEQHESPDAWHSHSAAEGQPQPEHGAKANPVILAGVGVASIVLVLGTIVATAVFLMTHTTKLRRERIETTVWHQETYVPYRQKSDAALAGFSWASPEEAEAGRVSLPIDAAKQRVIEKYASRGQAKPRAEAK